MERFPISHERLRELWVTPPQQAWRDEQRKSAEPVDTTLKEHEIIQRECIPAAESPVTDLSPERAGSEGTAATAALILDGAAMPKVLQLAYYRAAEDLADEVGEHGAAASR